MVLEEKSPWGIHKGVRPTNIPLKMLFKEIDINEIKRYMKEKYQISDEKLELCLKVAINEKKILETIQYKDGYSLYVGIPFCPSICAYCSFSSTPIKKDPDLVNGYLEKLEEEIEFSANLLNNKILNTVYVGGGTPTSISADQLDRFLNKLFLEFDIQEKTEVTVEAGRPDSITQEKLKVLKKYNISRISINPQSMKQKTLDIIGRKHSVDDIKKAFYLARENYFDNINMDIIVGLPEETIDDVKNTLEIISGLNPEGLTVHSLAIKRAAKFKTESQDFNKFKFNNCEKTMELTYEFAKSNNMEPYYLYRQKNMVGNMENIGYAKQGKEAKYNILIMEELQTILALGAGAITKLVDKNGKITRSDNVKDIENYINRIDEMKKRKSDLLCL